MPEVITITVTRRRSVQPAQYESASAEVELVANVLEGENWLEGARELLTEARALVYENLGMRLPDSVILQTVKVNKPESHVADKPARKRGRPKGSINTMPKANSKTPLKITKPEDDIPEDNSSVQEPSNLRDNPEDRVNPEDDIPEDDIATDSLESMKDFSYTGLDLHVDIHTAIKGTPGITVQQAQKLLAQFKVVRAKDLSPEEAVSAKVFLDAMLKD